MCWVFTEKSECSRMTNHDRSCLCLPLPNLRPSLSSAPMHVSSCCNDFMKMQSSRKFALPNISPNLLPCPLLTSPHNSQSRCLQGSLYFSWGKMLLGQTFCWDGVFEVFWTDIFNILLQESIPILWRDWATEECFICSLQHWEDNHDNKFTKLQTGEFVIWGRGILLPGIHLKISRHHLLQSFKL